VPRRSALRRRPIRAARLAYQGDELAPAEEAYVSVTARDRDTQVEWFSETYWLSELALADQDPERVRTAIAAIERSLAKLNAWLEQNKDQEIGAEGDEEQEAHSGISE
jgi:hypothetical protein